MNFFNRNYNNNLENYVKNQKSFKGFENNINIR